jgi:murein DD-endopeptidase MepM/ murein hydrolase activator NlpD
MIVFILIFNLYNKKLAEDAKQSILELGSINAIVPNSNTVNITSVSSSEDKDINEVKNETTKQVVENKNETITNTVEEAEKVVENTETEEVEETEEEPLTFIAPVNGEIIKDFANEKLVYSKTLEEWTVHNGIDIKANKTTVVLSSSDGVVESIKNDPRYGLTVTIAHRDGFKTIYANLLTAEFVTEGENIEQGRTIGTVGENASFEIADEAHLHFEMMKDGEYVNPTLYFN